MNIVKKIISACLLLAMCTVNFGYKVEAKSNNGEPDNKVKIVIDMKNKSLDTAYKENEKNIKN